MPKAKRKPLNKRYMTCDDMLDAIYHTQKICQFPVTNKKKKPCAFDELRPKSGKYLDYDISQTDAKIDAGPVKVHLQQTVATYHPFPPGLGEEEEVPPKRRKSYTGRAPVYTFYEEEILAQREKQQEFFRKALVKRIREAKRAEARKLFALHKQALSAVGPEWFQELSPKQMETAEKLKDCLMKDIKDGTINNTQENIAYLGLVMRPNKKHIALALKCCCGCPVEFLLILYQLINPERKTYTINDRLLLSSVVHLTMKETLRELHIRMPSPPPRRVAKTIIRKRKKQKRYDSPYLQPQRYEPEPRKYSGVYKNSHIQYPESPYFSYIPALKDEIKTTTEKFYEDRKNKRRSTTSKSSRHGEDGRNLATMSDLELEVELELRTAQEMYNKLAEVQPTPRLLRPSIYVPCDVKLKNMLASKTLDFADKEPERPKVKIDICECDGGEDGIVRSHGIELPALKSVEDVKRELEALKDSCDCTVCRCTGNRVMIKCGCCQKRQLLVQMMTLELGERARENLEKNPVKYVVSGVVKRLNRKPVYLIQCVRPPLKVCYCPENYEIMKRNDEIRMRQEGVREFLDLPYRFVVGGVISKPNQKPLFLLSGIMPEMPNVCICGNKDQKYYKVCEKKSMGPNKIMRFLNIKLRQQAVLELVAQPHKHIIGGVISRINEKPLFIIASVKASNPSCLKPRSIRTGYILSPRPCPPPCPPSLPCDRPIEPDPKVKALPHISQRQEENPHKCIICGIVNRPNVKPMTGIQPPTPAYNMCPVCCEKKKMLEQSCNCEQLKKLQKKLDRTMRQKAIRHLRELPDKYIISGVVYKSDTLPVYIIQGVQPPTRSAVCPAKEKLISLPTKESSVCDCKVLVRKYANEPACLCEKCVFAEHMRKNLEKVMGEVARSNSEITEKMRESERSSLVKSSEDYIQSSSSNLVLPLKCDCLERYEERIAQYESYRQRQKLVDQYEELSQKFVISGVVNAPDQSPLYIITGTKPEYECSCGYDKQRQEDEKKHLEALGKPPGGPIQFGIVGVCETANGPKYVLTGSKHAEDCTCMKLFKIFAESHRPCMEVYEKYLEKLKTDVEEYMSEVGRMDEQVEQTPQELVGTLQNESQSFQPPCESCVAVDEVTENKIEPIEARDNICSLKTEIKNIEEIGGSYICESHQESILSKDISLQVDEENEEDYVCPCESYPDESKLKRFRIFEKIPNNYKKQMNILKTLLKSLKDDGYPLAKLPECYRLPHFKLWMALRSGKFWRQEDRRTYTGLSRKFWVHVDYCFRKTPMDLLSLPMDKKEGDKTTFAKSAYVKKLVADKIYVFQKGLCQNAIDDSREFFPTLFTYEFPNPTFRDVFFAYMPSKQEDVHPFRPWNGFETLHSITQNKTC